MKLNEAGQGGELAPTDCRNRPDIRALEEGDLDLAASKKEYLENKQREFRKEFKNKRRATGGRQDGLCLQNRQSQEKMTGGQLETFGRVIFRDLLKYFRPLKHGIGWPKIIQFF